jgi:hypothetical protein
MCIRLVFFLAMTLTPSLWLPNAAMAQRSGGGGATISPAAVRDRPVTVLSEAPDLTCAIKASMGSGPRDRSQLIAHGQLVVIPQGDPRKIWAAVTVTNKGATEAKNVGASLSSAVKGNSGVALGGNWNLGGIYGVLAVPADGSDTFPAVPQDQLGDQTGWWSFELKAKADWGSAVGSAVLETNEQNNECTLAFTVQVGEANVRELNPQPIPIPIPALPPVQRPSRP